MVLVVHVCVLGGGGARWRSECAGRGGALDRQHPAHRRGPAGRSGCVEVRKGGGGGGGVRVSLLG